jgi:long-chain acyl-CoA synthetase
MYPGAIALNHPDRPAVIEAESGRQLTYQDLDENSARLAPLYSPARSSFPVHSGRWPR